MSKRETGFRKHLRLFIFKEKKRDSGQGNASFETLRMYFLDMPSQRRSVLCDMTTVACEELESGMSSHVSVEIGLLVKCESAD